MIIINLLMFIEIVLNRSYVRVSVNEIISKIVSNVSCIGNNVNVIVIVIY